MSIISRPLRKVVPLTPSQACSCLFCTRNSALYDELHGAWKLWISGDEATTERFKHLLPAKHNPKLPFVSFQQVVLREKVDTATEEDAASIQEYINTRFQEESERRSRPWQALKIDDSQLELELARCYVQE